MTGGKKYMIVLTEEQYNWIKTVATETQLKGSDVVREIIDRCMVDNPRQFKASLVNTQMKIKLQALNEKRAALDEEVAELQRQFKGTGKVAA